jgi:hypothetical protein
MVGYSRKVNVEINNGQHQHNCAGKQKVDQNPARGVIHVFPDFLQHQSIAFFTPSIIQKNKSLP